MPDPDHCRSKYAVYVNKEKRKSYIEGYLEGLAVGLAIGFSVTAYTLTRR
jgi:hypothetical protein